MTYLATGAKVLWDQVQLWTGRANQAWGTSRVWNTGSSFETDLAGMTSQRDTWYSRANQAWGTSRVWGQGSSFETDLSVMTTDRNNWQASSNTWQGRANSAWGASRTWNSGSSFETDLANMTADRNTWQSRANTAWGPSRVWGSGETWEQAYNRVLPAALTQYAQSIGATSASGNILAVTLGITGQYHIGWKTHHGDGSNTQWIYLELRRNGGAIDSGMARVRFSGVEEYCGGWWTGVCNAGDQIVVNSAGGPILDASLNAMFVPTQAQPH